MKSEDRVDTVAGIARRSWGVPELAVLALALALRATGIGFGLPFQLSNDELPLIGGALRMLELRQLVPSLAPGPMEILYYPPGLPYLYLVFFLPWYAMRWLAMGMPSTGIFADAILSDLSGEWLIARSLSVALSTATVWFVMRLAAAVFASRAAGLVAGVMLATSLHHAMLGHFARVWPPTVFLFCWGLWAAWRIRETGARRDYVAAAMAAGLGFAVNYIGVVVAIAAGLAHLAHHRRLVIDRAILLHAAIVAAFIAVFTALYWQNLVRLMGFSKVMASIPGAQEIGIRDLGLRMSPSGTLLHYADIVWRADPVLATAGALAVLWVFVRRPLLASCALLVVVAYLGVLLSGSPDDDRYILPVTPLLAIAIGGAVAALAGDRRMPAWLLGAALVAAPLAAAVQLNRLMLRPDTREVARSWLLQNHAGSGIGNAMRGVMFEPDMAGLALQAELDRDALTYLQRRKRSGARVLAGGGGPEVMAVNLLQPPAKSLAPLGPDGLHDKLVAAGVRWYVTDDLVVDTPRKPLNDSVRRRGEHRQRVTAGPPGIDGPIFNLSNQFERFSWPDLFKLERLGPQVDIYWLK